MSISSMLSFPSPSVSAAAKSLKSALTEPGQIVADAPQRSKGRAVRACAASHAATGLIAYTGATPTRMSTCLRRHHLDDAKCFRV